MVRAVTSTNPHTQHGGWVRAPHASDRLSDTLRTAFPPASADDQCLASLLDQLERTGGCRH